MARDYPFPFWHFPRPPWAKPVRGITHYLISRKLETIEDLTRAAAEALQQEDMDSAALFRDLKEDEERHVEALRAQLKKT